MMCRKCKPYVYYRSGHEVLPTTTMPMTSLTFKWAQREISLDVDECSTVGDVKHLLQQETRVRALMLQICMHGLRTTCMQVNPKRQKIIGLKRKDGKPAADEDAVSELALKPGTKLMFMGTPDEVIEEVRRVRDERRWHPNKLPVSHRWPRRQNRRPRWLTTWTLAMRMERMCLSRISLKFRYDYNRSRKQPRGILTSFIATGKASKTDRQR